MAQYSISQGSLKTDFVESNRPISAPNVKIRVLNGAMIFFNGLCQNNRFLGNSGLSKIRSLQCYEVLWIHNIDGICNNGSSFQKFSDLRILNALHQFERV